MIELKSFDISNHFDDDMINIEKNNFNKPISVIYFDGNKKSYYIKRFIVKNKCLVLGLSQIIKIVDLKL